MGHLVLVPWGSMGVFIPAILPLAGVILLLGDQEVTLEYPLMAAMVGLVVSLDNTVLSVWPGLRLI